MSPVSPANNLPMAQPGEVYQVRTSTLPYHALLVARPCDLNVVGWSDECNPRPIRVGVDVSEPP